MDACDTPLREALPLPAPPLPVSLPIQGSNQRFFVNRVFCLGRNYRWDAAAVTPDELFYFMKPNSAVIEAEGDIPFPPATEEYCHEIELVVAIGRGGSCIPADRALAHVWGYAAGLDMTRRDLQHRAKRAGGSWEAAKAFDGSAPIAALQRVQPDADAPQGRIWLKVNGELRQQADLDALIRPIAQAISELSAFIALQPGDLLMTGTPAGVAAVQPGDLIEAGVEGIGETRVRIAPRMAKQASRATQ